MRILLVKTSSMGDIIHTLPALTDAKKAFPTITFDWVIEEAFQSIPKWHDAVDTVLPIALRRWRQNLLSGNTLREGRLFYRAIHEKKYDLVLDAQGLIKSAAVSYLANAKERLGFDKFSAKEPLATWFYKKAFSVSKNLHAIERLRTLFSLTLHYEKPISPPDYGISAQKLEPRQLEKEGRPYFVFLHGTTWSSKMWPEYYWCELARLLTEAGFGIKISGGNKTEVERAKRIASSFNHIDVTPFLTINEMASILSRAEGVIAVDTGFAHLAAALQKPVITLYGATSATLTGTIGNKAENLIATFPNCTPCLKRECHYTLPSKVTPACYEALTPERVWEIFRRQFQQRPK